MNCRSRCTVFLKKMERNAPFFYRLNYVSANILSACPPSSRVSPFCLRQSPAGRDTLTARTLSGVASLCHLSLWCKKTERTSDCVQILVLGVRFLVAAAPRVSSRYKRILVIPKNKKPARVSGFSYLK